VSIWQLAFILGDMCRLFTDYGLFHQVVWNQFKSKDPAPAVKKLPHNDALMAQVCILLLLLLLPFTF